MQVKHLLAGVAVIALMAQPVLAQNNQPQVQAGQAQLADADVDFAKEAAGGGLLEVRLGELAQQQGKSQAVQDFGQRMVEDHGKANEELKQIAQQKGIELPQELSEDGQQTYDDLQQNIGAEFDEAYMDEMVSDHEDDVDTFESYVEEAQDPDLRAFAEQTLPTLKEHLELAKQTQEEVASAGGMAQPAPGTGSQTATGMASDQAAVPPAQGMISIDDVLGSQVVNSKGDEVGEIDDLVMQGDSYFAVLSVGGFLGIGDKEVAVPLDELKLGEDKSYLMSPETEEQLENLPEYRQHDYQQAPRG